MNGFVKIAIPAAVAIAAACFGAAAGYAVYKPVPAPHLASICATEPAPAAFVSQATPVIAAEAMPSEKTWMQQSSKVDF